MQRWIFNFVETSFLWLLPSGVTTANHLPSSNPIVWKQQSANQLKLRHLASQLSCTLQIELHHGHNILYMWTKYLIVAKHRYSIRCTQNTLWVCGFNFIHTNTKEPQHFMMPPNKAVQVQWWSPYCIYSLSWNTNTHEATSEWNDQWKKLFFVDFKLNVNRTWSWPG